MISRASLLTQKGGDSLQIERTASELRDLGYEVGLYLGEKDVEADSYDVLHVFNLIRPAAALGLVNRHTRLVISSIYVDYSSYERTEGSPLRQITSRILGKFGMEYLKSILRWINGTDRFPGWQYLIYGQYDSMKKLLSKASAVITASNEEAKIIARDFPDLPINFVKVKLGSEHFYPVHSNARDAQICCVARIEGLKNQKALIQSLSDTSHELDLIGAAAANQKKYFNQCQDIAGSNTRFMGFKTLEELQESLPRYKVHVLPSFFETTGLSTIEALVSGCSVVVTDHPIQHELFGDRAYYCNPKDPGSIRLAIDAAIKDQAEHSSWASEHFSWKTAAASIASIYQKLAL